MTELSIPHQKFVLPNGLTLVVHEDHATPVVAVNLWYHVGSRNERRGRTGFAHLFEHFFFNGSENHPGGFREAMDDLGANNRNGTTNTDRTNFFEDVPVQALERTLCLEADRMGFLAGRLNVEMLERERGVVKNEKRQNENQPYGRVFSRLAEAMYPYSHPYSWSTIGEMADLDAATIDDIREWYATYYGPNNCVLTLAGDITPDKALELVTKWFGSIPPGPPLPRHESWVGKLGASQRETMADRVPQARIYRAYHAPQWGSPDDAALSLATSVLSGTKSARLDRKLVYEKELVTDVSAGTWEREIAGLILISATVKDGVDPALVEREIDAILAEFLKDGPTKAELDRARTRMTTDFVRGIERIGGRANLLAENVTFGGDGNAHVAAFQRAAAATPESVRATAKTWLDAPSYTLVVTPFPSLKAGDSAGLDRKALPAIGADPEVRFPAVQEMRLANGLRVMLLERHGAPLVQATLLVDAGYSSDAPARRGLTSLATGLLTDGTTTKDAFALADAMDVLGAEIFATNTQDTSSLKLRALTQNLAGSFDLFADVALHPAFAADRFEQAKRRQIAGIAQEKATPTTAALRVLPAVLYGSEHAYGGPRTGSGTEASVESLKRDDVVSWHSEWFRPGSSVLIVAGDVTMDALMPHVERAFGAWKAGAAPTKSIGAPAGSGAGKILLIDKKDAPQSLLLAAHLTERTGSPEDLAIDQVMRDFGGMATSRLNRNLRLEKHWSYGMSGMLPDSRGPRPFLALGSVQTDKTKESLLEIAKEIRFIAGEKPITGEEFESLQRSSISRLPGRFETLSSLEAAAESMVAYGYPADYYDKLAANVRALTEADLARAATRFVKPSQVSWIVVGDLAKIEAGIRESGLGEVIVVDSDGKPLR